MKSRILARGLGVVIAPMLVDKLQDAMWDFAPLKAATSAQLTADIFRDIARPSLDGIERKHPNRIRVSPVEHVADDCLEVTCLHVRLAPDTAKPTEIVDHEVDVLTFVGNDCAGKRSILHI